jgi:hypothetical protein
METTQPGLPLAAFSVFAALIGTSATARDWQTQTELGQKIAAHAYCAGVKQSTCAETALPKIAVTTPPRAGTVDLENTMQTNVFSRVGEARTGKRCPALPRHCVEIYYTPAPDYRGADQFSYTVSNPDGQKWRDTIMVDVH